MKEIVSRINQYLLFSILVVIVLYFGRTFLIPIVFAALLAMLMSPICRRLDTLRFNRALSSFCCVFILILVIAGIAAIITAQFSAFAQDVEQIEKKSNELLDNIQAFVQNQFGVSPEKQEAAVKEQARDAGKAAGGLVTKVLGGFTSAIAGIVLTLVFTFLFLYNKERYESFFLKLYKDNDTQEVRKIVSQIGNVSQQYLTGRAMSIIIIAILYSIGLSIIGIKNAVLLAGIAALLTIIPYVGTIIGGLFPVMMALVTEDSIQPALLAVLVIFVIQTIDNYFIEPNIVGGEVNLSALTSILSIIAGGLVWGVVGMILFLPMVGIIKIICDHVEPLKPISFVLSDPNGNKNSKMKEWVLQKFGKTNRKKRK